MTVVIFAALIWKVIDFLRMLANFKNQKSGIITQLTAWVGGVLIVILGAHAEVTKALILPGSTQTLGSLDIASLIILGLLISSFASSLVDVKQAVDSSDSSAVPSLLGSTSILSAVASVVGAVPNTIATLPTDAPVSPSVEGSPVVELTPSTQTPPVTT